MSMFCDLHIVITGTADEGAVLTTYIPLLKPQPWFCCIYLRFLEKRTINTLS